MYPGVDVEAIWQAAIADVAGIIGVGDTEKLQCLADKLFKVWLLNGQETWLLIHIEVQGEPASLFEQRKLRDHCFAILRRRIWDLNVRI